MSDSRPKAPEGDRRSWRSRLPARAAPLVAMAAAGALMLRRRFGWRQAEAAAPPPLTPEALDAAEPGRGRAADAPWKIPPRGWKDIAWRVYENSGRHRLPSVAGGVTFYLLLATFPALAAFVSIYGMFLDLGAVSRLIDKLSQVFPQDAVNLIAEQMMRLSSQKHATLGAAFAFSALASVWSANAGLKALIDGLNVAYGETEKRWYVPRTLTTYAATLASLTFIVLVTALTIAAPVFLHGLGLHQIRDWMAPARWTVLYLIAGAGFTLVYRHGPSRAPPRWRWVAFGGFGAALLWMGGSMGFSTYLDNFTHFGATYGSLGAMIGFMLWVWFSVIVVLFGAEANAEIEHQTACDTTVGPPAPVGRRGAVMADTIGPAFTVGLDDVRATLRRQWDWARGLIGR